MGYRDENEQLRARVSELENDLAHATDTIARLTGKSHPSGDAEAKRSALLGEQVSVAYERELDFEVSEAGYEAIAELLRTRAPALGPVSQVGRSLSARGFTLTARDGRTHIRMSVDHAGVTLGALTGSALIGSFSALATFALVHDVVYRLSEAHILWMAPVFVALAFLPIRRLLRRNLRRTNENVLARFETVVELARQHALESAPVPPTRVATEHADELEVAVPVGPNARRSPAG